MKLLSKSRLFLLVVLALLLALPSGVLAQEPPAPAPIIKTDGVYGVDHPQNAGDVYLFKTVREIPGTLNTFHVTLHVEAKDAVKSNDIVLVIDTSGSMAGARIANAKAAARQFINEILVPEQTLTRIALVSFARDPSIRRNFTSYANKQSLINAVNDLQPGGGTNTQGGIHTAQTLLDNSNAEYKNIVLLSDGQPTYSYEIPNNTIRRNGYYIDAVGDYVTGTGYAASAFSSHRVGDGSSMYEYIERYNWRRAYYHHGNSAIAEAGFAKVAGSKIHSIALSAGAEGTPILQQISSAGSFYNTTNPAELTTIFSQIAAAISSAVNNASISAVNNASITDGMGVGFQLTLGDASNLDPSQGEAGYNTSTSTLSWNVGNLTKPVSDLGGDFATVDPLVKYAQLEYDVTINDNILGIPPPADGNYDVNRDATLKFTDINGAEKTSDFPVPLAKPVIVELRKEVRDNMGNLITADTSVVGRSETSDPGDRKFTFHVALRDTPTNYKDYIMNGTSSRVMADLRVDDFYTISESAITGAVQDNFADYDTTIRWQTWDNTQSSDTAIEGTTFENFKVPRDASNNPLNTTFTIVNKEKPLGVLNLTKHFDPTPGVDGDTVTAPIAGSTQEFTFHVTGPYNYVQDVKIKAGETKKLENLVYGVYTVVETAGGENFTVTYTDTYGDSANQSGTKSDGSVKLSFDNKTGGVTVLNTVKDGDVFTDFVAKKIWVNGDPNDHVAIQLNLYRDGDPVTNPPTPTVSPKDTTVAGQTTYTYTYTGLPKYRQDGGLSVYTVLENVQTQFYRVTYSDDKTQVYNTYKAPTANQVATKVWTDGENYNNGVRPTVWFQLWRSIAGGTAAAVPGAEVKELPNGTTTVTWENLPTKNDAAQDYVYTVKEVRNAGTAEAPNWVSYTPEHYTKTETGLTVTNTFMQPESATLEITASKTLSGAALKNEQFTFALSVADSDVNLNAKNDETGAVVFEPISFNKQGDYLITVREVDEKARNYIYDGTTYTILVKVTTDKNNVLQLETTYERDGQPHEGELQFTNTYEKEPSAITSSPIAARVELIGRTLKDREFEFQLRDGADNVMDTVRNGPDGRFSFGTQRFSREGTYVYTIQQVKGTEEGMFYDMEPIRVRITVREGRSGMLEVFMEFLLPTAHATDTGRVLTSGTTYTKAGVDVTSDPLLTNRVGIPPTGDNALTMPLVMMALSLMGLGLWLFSKMRRTDTV